MQQQEQHALLSSGDADVKLQSLDDGIHDGWGVGDIGVRRRDGIGFNKRA